MTSFLYLLSCTALAVLAATELKTRNRTPRIQLYVTLLCALVFCGAFALLVSAAQQFRTLATVGVLLLTGASLNVLTRTARRFRTMHAPRHWN